MSFMLWEQTFSNDDAEVDEVCALERSALERDGE